MVVVVVLVVVVLVVVVVMGTIFWKTSISIGIKYNDPPRNICEAKEPDFIKLGNW